MLETWTVRTFMRTIRRLSITTKKNQHKFSNSLPTAQIALIIKEKILEARVGIEPTHKGLQFW